MCWECIMVTRWLIVVIALCGQLLPAGWCCNTCVANESEVVAAHAAHPQKSCCSKRTTKPVVVSLLQHLPHDSSDCCCERTIAALPGQYEFHHSLPDVSQLPFNVTWSESVSAGASVLVKSRTSHRTVPLQKILCRWLC